MPRSYSDVPRLDLPGLMDYAVDCSARLSRAAIEQGPIFRWTVREGREAGQERLSLVGPEANRMVFHTHRDHFSHARGWTPIVDALLGRSLLSMDDAEHALHRRIWNPAFARAALEAHLPFIQRAVDRRIERWPDRGEIDVAQESRQISFEAAATALAGLEPGRRVDRMREEFRTLLQAFDRSVESPEAYFDRTRLAQMELLTQLLSVVRARRAASGAAAPRDLLGMIVDARDGEGKPLGDTQVLDHLRTFLAAGHETTTPLAAWTLHLLAATPARQDRIAGELQAAIRRDGDCGMAALADLPLLDQFIKESARLRSPVANLPRGVVKPFEFGGYEVPEGTQVRLSLGGGHRLPDVFADPESFDPDRFAPPREEDKRRPYSLVPFGAGPRACIGQPFAHLEVKAIVAAALRRFELQAADGDPPLHAGFYTCFLPGPLRVRVVRKPLLAG